MVAGRGIEREVVASSGGVRPTVDRCPSVVEMVGGIGAARDERGSTSVLAGQR
jgi:hypothetical protein